MKLLIFYDIVKTKDRNNIVEILENYGFYRLQFSVYIGNVKSNKVDTLSVELSSKIRETDLLYIVPFTESAYKNVQTLGESKQAIFMTVKRNEFDFEDIVIWISNRQNIKYNK